MTVKQYWPVYLSLHSQPTTKSMHAYGTIAAWIIFVCACIKGAYWLIPFCPMYAYAMGFLAHAFVEHNKPASFTHPILSIACDHILTWKMITRKISA